MFPFLQLNCPSYKKKPMRKYARQRIIWELSSIFDKLASECQADTVFYDLFLAPNFLIFPPNVKFRILNKKSNFGDYLANFESLVEYSNDWFIDWQKWNNIYMEE